MCYHSFRQDQIRICNLKSNRLVLPIMYRRIVPTFQLTSSVTGGQPFLLVKSSRSPRGLRSVDVVGWIIFVVLLKSFEINSSVIRISHLREISRSLGNFGFNDTCKANESTYFFHQWIVDYQVMNNYLYK